MDQRSKTTSHRKRDSDTVQHGELRSDRGCWFINDFFLKLAFCNIHDTFKASSSSSSTSPPMTSSTVSSESVARQERRDPCGIDPCPAAVSSKHVERQERGDLLTKPTKNPKPNKNEDHDLERRDPCHSDIPEWVQEFRENLVDDRVPEHRDSHASSSHELSLEPTPARSAELGKHSVYTHFRKTEIARSARGQKSQGPRAEDALAESYLVQKILVIWLQQITKFSLKVVNLETIIDMQSWCRTWPPNGSSHIRAEQKLLRKHKGVCKSSWSRIGSLKSFTLTILGIWQGLWRIDLESLYVNTAQIGNAWDCWESSTQSKGRHFCGIVAIRSEWKLVGRFHGMLHLSAKHSRSLVWWGVLENLLKDQSFRLVHWLSITQFLRKIIQESINLERKSFLDCSLDTRFVRGRNLEGWHIGCRPWGVGDDGRIGNLLKKTQCKRGHISERKWTIYFILFSSRWWTNQNTWRRSGTENIHLDTGSPTSRRKSRTFFGESEGSLPPPHDSFPDAGEAINDFRPMSGSFIYRHHVQPRVKHRFHSVCSIRKETSRRIYVVREETDKKAANIQRQKWSIEKPKTR